MQYNIEVIDSHTDGEPTRMVVNGFPTLRGATMQERLDDLRTNHDHLRAAILDEPRGYSAVVGAILTPPVTPGALTGAIYCNDMGYLRMCGHATIGVVRSLQYLGKLKKNVPGSGKAQTFVIDTPVGSVQCTLQADDSVSVRNVASYVHALDVTVDVPGLGKITGDISYGGNWFFIVPASSISLLANAPKGESSLAYSRLTELLDISNAIREALAASGITGRDGAYIDHIEISAPPLRGDAHSRNFVFCGRYGYDRSPCGTGTSAKIVTLLQRGELAFNEEWRQEGILGSLFVGSAEREGNTIIPTINGHAWVSGTATLFNTPGDPFAYGITSK